MSIPPAAIAATAGDGIAVGSGLPIRILDHDPVGQVSGRVGEASMSSAGRLRTNSDPGSNFITITPSDTTTYDPPLRGVYVGVTGNVAVMGDLDQVAVIFIGCPAGFVIPGVVRQVMETNTTASSLVGLY